MVSDDVLFQVFQHLLLENPDIKDHPPTFESQLAELEWSEDHKVLTFRLRDDLFWSDGVRLTADDVYFSWQAQNSKSPVAWNRAYMKDAIDEVKVVDAQTVRFHFKDVYARQIFDVNEGLVLPKHVWSQLPFEQWGANADWFFQHRVASGPFKIHSWKRGQDMVLIRNERYWEKDRPYLDRVVLRFVPDSRSLLTQLLSGDLDFITQVSPQDAKLIQENPHLQLVDDFWSNLYVVLAWNNERPLFADPEVRCALTMAINRQQIVDTLFPNDTGRVGISPIIQSVWAHDKTLLPYPYNPAEAQRKLAEKGWMDSDGDGILDRRGEKFSFELTTHNDNRQRSDAAEMIQEQLKAIGIEVRVRKLEFSAQVAEMQRGDFDGAIMGFTVDTSLDLSGHYSSHSIGKGGNYFRYSNDEVDRLIYQVAGQPNISDARPLLHGIERLIYDDQPATFLWESKRLMAFNRRIQGAKPNLQGGFFNLKDWWVSSP